MQLGELSEKEVAGVSLMAVQSGQSGEADAINNDSFTGGQTNIEKILEYSLAEICIGSSSSKKRTPKI